MTVINAADALYLNGMAVDALYLGQDKVWPPPSFGPKDLTGLVGWFDASQTGLADGAALLPWNDLSTQGRHLNAGYAATLKTNVLNGLPVARFDGVDDNLVAAASGNYQHIFVVATNRNAVFLNYEGLLGGVSWLVLTGNSGGSLWYPYEEGGTTTYHLNGVEYPSNRPAPMGGQFGIMSISRVTPWPIQLQVGCDRNVAGRTWPGDVAEVIAYDRKLSTAEQIQVENYLRQKWGVGGPVVPAYDTATQAYLDATGLDTSYAPALDSLVKGLKSAGLWTKMAAVYPFVGGSEALHRWNLKDPRDTDDAYRLTFTGGAHSTALGYRANPDGGQLNGSYADTHLIPRGTFEQDSTSLAFYSLANVAPKSRCEMGCYAWEGDTANRFHVIACYTGSLFYYGMAEHGVTGTPVPNSTGLFVATRTGPSTQSAYRNGTLVETTAMPSIWLPPVPIWVGGINSFHDRSDLPCGFASIGTGLDAQNNADLYTVVQNYQTALGRQVL